MKERLTVSYLLLNDRLPRWLRLGDPLLLLGVSGCNLLLVMLLLKFDLLLNHLLFAWLFTILVAAGVLALLPGSTARTWARHHTD